MRQYVALLRKQKGTDYGVNFPDFPGCVTAGRTLEEARRMAAEALKGHVATMLEYGERLPTPTSLDSIMADAANRKATAFLVDVYDPAHGAAGLKPVRVALTLPQSDIRRIDRLARRSGISRAKLLREAVRRLITSA
jgi:predicted RNase H-like HicB family nuclease